MKESFFGRHTIYGVDGEHDTPYMTRYWIGRLRLHIFYRGDADPDPHDHPWWFITFPLTSYVEEIYEPLSGFRSQRVVKRFRFHYRPAEFAHRVLGAWAGWSHVMTPGQRIFTIVWRGSGQRKWGFWRTDCPKWVPWKVYVSGGGKHAPCEQTGQTDNSVAY